MHIAQTNLNLKSLHVYKVNNVFLYKLDYEPMKVKATPKSQAKVGFVTQTENDDERYMLFA